MLPIQCNIALFNSVLNITRGSCLLSGCFGDETSTVGGSLVPTDTPKPPPQQDQRAFLIGKINMIMF